MANCVCSTMQTGCNKVVGHISEILAESSVVFDTTLLKTFRLGSQLGRDVVAMGNMQQVYQSSH